MILGPQAPPVVERLGWGLCFCLDLPPTRVARWAWLADTHVSADPTANCHGVRPVAQLERFVKEVRASRTSGVLVNGDLAWKSGELGDYSRLADLLQPLRGRYPLVLVPGNHDRRANMLAQLGGMPRRDPGRIAAIVDQPPFRLVALDSVSVEGDVGGEIGTDQLEWLDGLLARTQPRLTFLFVHHPGESTSEGCRDFQDLQAIARSQNTVRAIITAHDHEFAVARAGGHFLIALPALGFPFDPATQCGWIEACCSAEGARLYPRGRLSGPVRSLFWEEGTRAFLDSRTR